MLALKKDNKINKLISYLCFILNPLSNFLPFINYFLCFLSLKTYNTKEKQAIIFSPEDRTKMRICIQLYVGTYLWWHDGRSTNQNFANLFTRFRYTIDEYISVHCESKDEWGVKEMNVAHNAVTLKNENNVCVIVLRWSIWRAERRVHLRNRTDEVVGLAQEHCILGWMVHT